MRSMESLKPGNEGCKSVSTSLDGCGATRFHLTIGETRNLQAPTFRDQTVRTSTYRRA